MNTISSFAVLCAVVYVVSLNASFIYHDNHWMHFQVWPSSSAFLIFFQWRPLLFQKEPKRISSNQLEKAILFFGNLFLLWPLFLSLERLLPNLLSILGMKRYVRIFLIGTLLSKRVSTHWQGNNRWFSNYAWVSFLFLLRTGIRIMILFQDHSCIQSST